MNKHLKAILDGVVDKTNVIGIRKALKAAERRECGYSVSCTAPKLTALECEEIELALAKYKPRVTGALHKSGLDRLRNPRYRKRLASVMDVIEGLTEFRLVGYEDGTPVYKACSATRSFLFKNVSWQAGGDGPELI